LPSFQVTANTPHLDPSRQRKEVPTRDPNESVAKSPTTSGCIPVPAPAFFGYSWGVFAVTWKLGKPEDGHGRQERNASRTVGTADGGSVSTDVRGQEPGGTGNAHAAREHGVVDRQGAGRVPPGRACGFGPGGAAGGGFDDVLSEVRATGDPGGGGEQGVAGAEGDDACRRHSGAASAVAL